MTGRHLTLTLALAAVATLPVACSSSGSGAGSGNGVSATQLTNKLASEPQLEKIAAQSHLSAAITKSIAACLAAALQKDADPAALNDYVSGRKAITDVTDRGSTSTKALGQDAAACLARIAPDVVLPTTGSTHVRISG